MKMIQAIIRPEKEKTVIRSLGKAGIHAFSRAEAMGRGRQQGIQVGPVHYEEVAKIWLMIVVKDSLSERAVETIKIAAQTGNPGDGKIFISSLVESLSLRTRSPDEE